MLTLTLTPTPTPTLALTLTLQAGLGRLVSPCLCVGSMRFVHVECLQQWRSMAANPRSFFRCDNCLFEYRFGRAFVAYDRCSATVAVPLALFPQTRALTLRST